MKTKANSIHILTALFMVLLNTAYAFPEGRLKQDDIYLVIYTTKKGHTGHVGFAVDNYKVVVRQVVKDNDTITRYDSLRTHSLTYFDLWGPADIQVGELDQDLPARYYILPKSSSERRITADYFLSKGLPHSYDYPCDALIRIRTTPSQDARMKAIAEAMQSEKNFFNGRSHNCTDYVLECLNRLFNKNITAREYIPFQWSSTPNQLYKKILETLEVEILKAAGEEVNNSFWKERVINTVIYNQFINHEKTKE